MEPSLPKNVHPDLKVSPLFGPSGLNLSRHCFFIPVDISPLVPLFCRFPLSDIFFLLSFGYIFPGWCFPLGFWGFGVAFHSDIELNIRIRQPIASEWVQMGANRQRKANGRE